jgi:hypothetical protein
MQEAAPLPYEKDIVPLRRHKMTEEEFQKIDIAKDLTSDQYSKLKALLLLHKDVFTVLLRTRVGIGFMIPLDIKFLL